MGKLKLLLYMLTSALCSASVTVTNNFIHLRYKNIYIKLRLIIQVVYNCVTSYITNKQGYRLYKFESPFLKFYENEIN